MRRIWALSCSVAFEKHVLPKCSEVCLVIQRAALLGQAAPWDIIGMVRLGSIVRFTGLQTSKETATLTLLK